MRTILSKSGHGALLAPVAARAVNAQLFAVQPLVRPLELCGVVLALKHVHVDRGLYAAGTCSCSHCHREIQIVYALSGRFLFATPDASGRLGAGCGNIIFPDTRHSWRCEASGAMLGILIEASGPRHEFFLRTMQEAGRPVMPVFKSPQIAVWTRRLFDLLAARPATWRIERMAGMLEIWLREALLEALDLDTWSPPFQAGPGLPSSHGRHICERALDFMTANYSRPIHLRDIAAHAGVSARHLNRLFRRLMRQGVGGHLAGLRLAKAKALLREQPALSIKETAYASGFSSPAYFSHCFKKAYHCLPRKMRR